MSSISSAQEPKAVRIQPLQSLKYGLRESQHTLIRKEISQRHLLAFGLRWSYK